MNRARRLKPGNPAYDRTTDADRRFFARHADRSHRVRTAAAAEVDDKAGLGALVDCPAGLKWFVVVRQLAPGFRMRLFFRDAAGRETDLSEAAAASIWAGLETDQTKRQQVEGLRMWEARNAG